MVATGRQSAFDRHLAAVPYKGQVLNQISLWWFEQTAHIIPNHVIRSPHPNVIVGRKCEIFPIEFVVRGYMTGSTSTSMWTHYNNGERTYCGYALPDGMTKNQKVSTRFDTREHPSLIAHHSLRHRSLRCQRGANFYNINFLPNKKNA